MPEEVPDFAANLQALAEKSGVSQAELARRSGMSRDSFNRYHSGKTRPPADKLHDLAKVFGVHPNDIDPTRLVLMKKTDVKPAEPYFVSEAKNGDPGYVNLSLNIDVSVTALSQILEIIKSETKATGG